MKRFLLFLTCALMLFGIARAEEKTVTWKAQTNANTSTTSLSAAGWTLYHDATGSFNWDGSTGKGLQIGSSGKAPKTITITSSESQEFSNKTITKVVVNASGASGATATLSVKVGNTNYSPTSVSLSTTATDYTFKGNSTGPIVITYNQPSTTKALYLLSIEVTYDNSPTIPPVVDVATPEISCVNNQVSISCSTESSTIYYTTNGDIPSSTSTRYTSSFSISQNTTVKAIAYVGTTPSEVATKECTYSGGSTGGGTTGGETGDIEIKTDKLTNSNTINSTATSYSEWTYESTTSDAIYKGYTAGGNSSIQINNNSTNGYGIVTTTSGGRIKSIKVTFNSSTSNSRVLNIFASTSPYSAPKDLYDSSKQGTKVTTFTYSSNQNPYTYTFEDTENYNYVGIISNANAIYISSIEIEWEQTNEPPTPDEPVDYTTLKNYLERVNNQINFPLNGSAQLELGDSHPQINFLESGSNILSFTAEGKITAIETGYTTVTASWDAVENIWNEGKVTFNVTVTEAVKVPGKGDEFELVTSTDALESGKYYVIAFTYDGTTYTMGERTSGNIPAISEDISLNGDILTIASATITLQLEETGEVYKWKACNEKNNGSYLSWGTSVSTGLDNKGDETKVSFDGNSVKITNGSRWIMGRPSSNDFRAYSQNQSDALMPNLYKLVEPKAPALPIVKIGELELKNGGSKTVLAGTVVSYECENSTTITATFNGTPISSPFTLDESGDLVVYGTNEVGDGEKFTYTFTVDTKESFPEVGSNFAQILNGEEPAEGFYVIAKGKENGTQNGIFAMSNIVSTQNNIPATSNITIEQISDNKALLTTTAEDVLIVKLIKESGQNFIKTVNLGEGFTTEQKYLSSGTGSTDLIFTDNEVPVYITITGGNNNNATLQFSVDAGTRKVALGGSANNLYFNYQTSGDVVQLYKYTTANIFKPEVEDVKLRLTENETYTLPTYENAPELSYSIAQEGDVISISDGEIKAMNTGEAVVTVSWKESDDWFAGSATFTVTVLPPIVDITETFGFRYPSVRGKKDVGVLSQAVYYEGDGKVEYSIWEYKFADPADKTLTPSTDVTIQEDGMIRPEDIENAVINKVYTVKANVAETDLYTAGEASYTFVIEAPVEASKGNLIEDLTTANESNRWKDANGNGYQLTGSYQDDPFILTSNTTDIEYTIYKGCYQNKYFQLAKDPLGYISFTIPNNCKSVTIGWGENSSSKTPGSLTVSIDGKEDQTFVFYQDTKIDVQAKGGSKMTIKNGDSNYVIRMSNLIFEIPTSKVPESGLYFDVSGDGVEHYINVFEDETIKLPELISAEGMKFEHLIFDIDEIDEEDDAETYQGYTITANDFDDISIDINYPGVYTFRAEYNAAKLVERGTLDKVEDAKFLDGMAILRLNVFPRLTVVPSDNHDSTLADDERTNAPELTLVQTVEEDGEETALITLPSIEALENSFKYSTIKIVRVEIKHGETTETYEGEELAKLNPEMKFTEDGYVKYTVRYANTEAFQTESTVHVVLMPQTPVAEKSLTSANITPSKNAQLQYAYVKKSQQAKTSRRAAATIDDSEWMDVDNDDVWTSDGNGSWTANLNAVPEGTQSIAYRSVKDITGIVAEGVDPILASEPDFLDVVETEYYLVGRMANMQRNPETGEFEDEVTFGNPSFKFVEGTDDDGNVIYTLNVASLTLTDEFYVATSETEFYKCKNENEDLVNGNTVGLDLYPESAGGEYNLHLADNLHLAASKLINITFTLTPSEDGYVNLVVSGELPDAADTWSYAYGNDKTMQSGEVQNIDGKQTHVISTQSKNAAGNYVAMLYVYAPKAAPNVIYCQITPEAEVAAVAEPEYKAYPVSSDGSYHISLEEGSGTLNLYYLDADGQQTDNATTYYKVQFSTPTGVEGIDAEDSDVEYYDLNGFKVDADRLEKGIYIRVQNGKAVKVMM